MWKKKRARSDWYLVLFNSEHISMDRVIVRIYNSVWQGLAKSNFKLQEFMIARKKVCHKEKVSCFLSYLISYMIFRGNCWKLAHFDLRASVCALRFARSGLRTSNLIFKKSQEHTSCFPAQETVICQVQVYPLLEETTSR